jgi:hypothetical protein
VGKRREEHVNARGNLGGLLGPRTSRYMVPVTAAFRHLGNEVQLQGMVCIRPQS